MSMLPHPLGGVYKYIQLQHQRTPLITLVGCASVLVLLLLHKIPIKGVQEQYLLYCIYDYTFLKCYGFCLYMYFLKPFYSTFCNKCYICKHFFVSLDLGTGQGLQRENVASIK